MSTITVHTGGGLCSRLRAVIAAVGFAQNTNRRLVVNWPQLEPTLAYMGGKFLARFSDLWSFPCEEIDWGRQHRRDRLEGGGDLHMRTCHPEAFPLETFAEPLRHYICQLVPTVAVTGFVDAVAWPVGVPVIGVHVRHTNAQPDGLRLSPLSWFIDRMGEIIAIRDDVRFFLATDSRSVAWTLEDEFPKRIVVQNKDYFYDKVGIQKAAADLYLLKRTDWMLGSYKSSFSEMVGLMRGGDYEPGWGRPGWLAGARYEDAKTPPRSDVFLAAIGWAHWIGS